MEAIENLTREEQLDSLLREARFWIWSYEAPSKRMAVDRDQFLERVERVLKLQVQGKQYTIQR